MEVWRVLDSGETEGYLNMAIDEAILWSCQKGDTPPTLRFYRWDQPTLSIGYSQNVFKEFNIAACRERKYPIVRRITGGRAVLHDQEVTYSVVVPKRDSLFSTSVLEAYRLLGAGLVEGCKRLGIEAQMLPRVVPGNSQGTGRSPICFSSPSWYEIVAGGKKLIGSAQRRLDGALLQQGSILTKFNPEPLVAILHAKSGEAVRELLDRITSMRELLKKEVSYQEVISAMMKGFERGCGVMLQRGELTPLEWKMAYQLCQTKYSQDAWNYKL